MNKKFFISVWAIFFYFMTLSSVLAAGETEHILEKRTTSVTPIFMPNHVGDQNWIQGFQFEGDIFLRGKGEKIGSFSGEALFANPPLNLAETYEHFFMSTLNDIPGFGTFQETTSGLTLGSSANNGDVVLAWSGSISNGTGFFENNYGLTAGNSAFNIFTGVGIFTEVLNIRNGL